MGETVPENRSRKTSFRRSTVVGLLVASSTIFGGVPGALAAGSPPPVTAPDTYGVGAGLALDVFAPGPLGNDTLFAAATTMEVVDLPDHGALRRRPSGQFRYTPRAGFVGIDHFSYRAVGSAGGASAPTLVTIHVEDLESERTIGYADAYRTTPGTELVVPAPGPLGNDRIVRLGAVMHVLERPDDGVLRRRPSGQFRYQPRRGFVGTDSFTYQVVPGVGLPSAPTTVTVQVGGSGSPPVATGESFTLDEDGGLILGPPGLMGNDVDPDGDPLTLELLSSPAHGSINAFADGTFEYYPDSNRDDDVSFTYQVSDGSNLSNVVTVTIDILAVNDTPEVLEDNYEFVGPGPHAVLAPGVLANDSDPVEFDDARVWGIVRNPSFGTVLLTADGAFTWTPTAGYFGCDSFDYQGGDFQPGATATVSVCNIQIE